MAGPSGAKHSIRRISLRQQIPLPVLHVVYGTKHLSFAIQTRNTPATRPNRAASRNEPQRTQFPRRVRLEIMQHLFSAFAVRHGHMHVIRPHMHRKDLPIAEYATLLDCKPHRFAHGGVKQQGQEFELAAPQVFKARIGRNIMRFKCLALAVIGAAFVAVKPGTVGRPSQKQA